MPDLVDEIVNHRKLPGEGEFPIRDYVAVCRELGYDGPWGVEVLSEELRNLPIERDLRPSLRDERARSSLPSRKGARVPETASTTSV